MGTSVKYVTALKVQVLLLGEAFTVIGRESLGMSDVYFSVETH